MEFQEFEKLPDVITAEKWDGTIEGAELIAKMITDKLGRCDVTMRVRFTSDGSYRYLEISLDTRQALDHVRENDWLVYFESTKSFEVWGDRAFAMKFKKKENQDAS